MSDKTKNNVETKKDPEIKKGRAIKMPHTYVIIFGVILFCWLLTALIPLGKFDTKDVTFTDASGKEKTKTVLVATSFRYQYALDTAKLKPALEGLVTNDAMIADKKLDKAALEAFVKTDPSTWDQSALDDVGLEEPVLYSLFRESIYDTSTRLKNTPKIWGTEDFYGFGILNYVFEGLVTGDKWGSAVGIVAFILVIGGAFGIIMRTGAIDAGIYAFIGKVKGYEAVSIPLLFFLFALGGAVFGMSEETIPFAMIIIPFCIAIGYDSLTGVAVTFVASQIGNATSWMNPFGVAIAQGIAGVPVLSGAPFRIIMFIIVTALAIVYLSFYTRKIKKNPEASPVYQTDAYWRNLHESKEGEKQEFLLGHKLILLSILAGMIWVIWGVTAKAYYIPEIASQFFVMGLVSGIIAVIFKIGNMDINEIAISFQKGAADLVGAALVVGMAKGVLLVLGGSNSATPTVLNTILASTGNALQGLPSTVVAISMYTFQTIFNFFVTSNSGQAALTMPILAPLSDLVGVTRQVAVLCYQLGSGFADAIVPTSASLMGVLGIARIEWGTWAKWQIKMQGFLFLLGCIFLVIAIMIGFN